MRTFTLPVSVILIGLTFAAFAQTGEIRTPDQIIFKAPLRPGAGEATVLYGDPSKQGLYVVRVKFPAGHKTMPHWHPDERTVVVLSGILLWGFGEQWDEAQLKAATPGTFITEPPKAPHYNWAKDGEVILQITGYGPSGVTNIPQK